MCAGDVIVHSLEDLLMIQKDLRLIFGLIFDQQQSRLTTSSQIRRDAGGA